MAFSGDYMSYNDEEILEMESIFENVIGSSLTSDDINAIVEENYKTYSKPLPIYEDTSTDDNEIAIKLLMNRLRNGLNSEMEYLERQEILNNSFTTSNTTSSSSIDKINNALTKKSSELLISSEISSNKSTCCATSNIFNQRVTSIELYPELENILSNDSNSLRGSISFGNDRDDKVVCYCRKEKNLRKSQEFPDLFTDEYNNEELNQIDGNKCDKNDEFLNNIAITSMIADDDNKTTDTCVDHHNVFVYNFFENDVNNVNNVELNVVQDNNNAANDDLYCLQERKKYLIKCIEELIKSLVESFKETGNVTLLINDTSKWNNLEFSEQMLAIRNESTPRNISINNERTQFRFTLINYLLNEILKRLLAGITCTLRELYYQEPELCQDQVSLTKALHDICCLLQCTPWELGIHSSSKGLIAGSLLISFLENTITDCSAYQTSGFLLPKATETIEIIDCNAEFILLIEKDTIFEKLLQQKIFQKINKEFILITGKGYPDINTRLILRKILDKYNIPIFALMDADPYGIEIMLTYSYGSKELSFMSQCLACPEIQWIGVLPSEIELLGIPSIQLTNEDKMRINDLLKRPYINNIIRKELNVLLEFDRKAEIEGISSFSFNFLVNNYIPNKIG